VRPADREAAVAVHSYRIEQGAEDASPELRGRFWWTLLRPDWIECETSPRTWPGRLGAIAGAERAAERELARGKAAWS
jgi:hypothetical protein